MPFNPPIDPRELIHCGSAFNFDRELAGKWGKSKFFRVSGITNALAPLRLTRADIEETKPSKKAAVAAVTKNWKDFFPTEDPQSWTSYGRDQIIALKSRAPQTLDKALMSFIYLQDWAEQRLRRSLPDNFLEPVKIIPILWTVGFESRSLNGASGNVWNDHIDNKPLYEALHNAIKPNGVEVVNDALFFRRRVSHWTAKRLSDVLNGHEPLHKVGVTATPLVPIDRGMGSSASELLDNCKASMHGPLAAFMPQNSS